LVQALDLKSSPLLQVPHFNEDTLKHVTKGKNSTSNLMDFVSRDPEQRKGLSELKPEEVLDVEEFCTHMSDVEVKAEVIVEDESEIVVGDIATVSISLTRKHLKEGEAAGPVHAPFFPEPKDEEWWVFLTDGPSRIICFEKIKSPERIMEEKLRFPIQRPGKYKLWLHAMCDSYAGIDKRVELNFTALTQDQVKREIIIHKEDEDLDLQPTLFQQFMGDLGHDDESEEEEDEKPKKAAKGPVKRDIGKSPETRAKSDTESGDDSTKQGQGGDDSDSSSSSDSDSD